MPHVNANVIYGITVKPYPKFSFHSIRKGHQNTVPGLIQFSFKHVSILHLLSRLYFPQYLPPSKKKRKEKKCHKNNYSTRELNGRDVTLIRAGTL